MASSIERLPVELFELIASELDLPAYQYLRLSSRHLHLLTLTTFTKRYFSELTTTLGSSSLDRLVNVSSHDHLSSIVTLLDIKILTHRDYKLLTKINRVGIFPPPKRFPRLSGLSPEHISEGPTLYDNVLSREYPKCIVDRLTRSLRGFSNLKTVRFRAHHREPYGWRSIAMPEGDQVFRTKCFHAVFEAIIKSEIQLEDFSMAKAKKKTTLSKCANLPYPTLQLPLRAIQSLQNCFMHLQSLTISIISAYNGDSRVPGWENCLSQLTACAPNVKNLALSLDRNSRVSHYSAAIIHSLASSCQLDSLETFHLVNCSLHEADLAAFVTTHTESLHQLIFADIRLLTGSWSSFWVSLKAIDGLRCLRLTSLEGIKSPVLFQRREKERLKITLDVGKSARPISAMLDDLVAACSIETELSMDGIAVD